MEMFFPLWRRPRFAVNELIRAKMKLPNQRNTLSVEQLGRDRPKYRWLSHIGYCLPKRDPPFPAVVDVGPRFGHERNGLN
jgi:hypothetical protein